MKIRVVIIAWLSTFAALAQAPYWVYLNGGKTTDCVQLSLHAQAKRYERGIALDARDYPINAAWARLVAERVEAVYGPSRWLNAIAVSAYPEQVADLLNLSFVSRVASMRKYNLAISDAPFVAETDPVSPLGDAYSANTAVLGAAAAQMEQIAAEFAFNSGFRGQGMTIAVFDGGFNQVDQMGVFDHLFADGRLLGTWDLVADSTVFAFSNHGTHVLSIMAAFDSSIFVGPAPDANYYLFRTEDVSSETHLEEYNWLRAAEMADSLGVDVINSSLGYTVFDEGELDYEYSNMDGNQTVVTQAADWAASKGILVVNSNGNYAQNGWTYMGAPADGDSVLAVGAVDSLGMIAPFSSLGPTYDGRIKPNVSARGAATALVSVWNNVQYGNGTSYSGPLIAAASASLWQQFPNLSNMEIISGIEQSAHLAQIPNNTYGYGIPNYQLAAGLFSAGLDELPESTWTIYPNPGNSDLHFFVKNPEPRSFYTLRLIDVAGNLVASWENLRDVYMKLEMPPHLPAGLYVVQFEQGLQVSTHKWIKLP
jgi:hypothetical protein